ncbi:hypothetical protein PHMEG_00015413 [Phytophthora megakarya]|uniref:Chromo domain-containing protein n=1 Tax=Phytophthora megakarya TaxID=4795 RepID=A0A225W1I8_9STRA|nr:hypothetical protein PHMEG_00015413 [Phytophthora megakarya]
MHSIRAYVEEPNQPDWDDHPEKLMHALNISFDAARLDTPFYLLHRFDCRSTISAMLGPKPTDVAERTAYKWRQNPQRDYSYAHTIAENSRRKPSTRKWKALSDHLKSGFEVGDSVWLYIPNVLPGLSRKLAHLIEQVRDDFKVNREVQDTGYRVEPWVHISRLKPRALFPKRLSLRLDILEDDDFDAALLPEDSWEPDSVHQEYEVEEIADLRWTICTRNARRIREYLIKWKGYDELQWLPVSQLNCGFLLYKFNQSARVTARFAAM